MALLEAGAAILGGLLGKSKPKYVIPPYAKIRDEAEAAGFNPLFAMSTNPGSVVMSENPMGRAISEAALAMADTAALRKQSAQQRLETQNEQLQQKVNRLSLTPQVAGVYGGDEGTTFRQIGANANAGSVSNNAARSGGVPVAVVGGVAPPFGLLTAGQYANGQRPYRAASPLEAASPSDPRWMVRPTGIVSDPGFAYIDNAVTGRRFPVPAFNGEILDVGQAAVLAAAKGADFAQQQALVRKWAAARPGYALTGGPYSPDTILSARSATAAQRRFERAMYWTDFTPSVIP